MAYNLLDLKTSVQDDLKDTGFSSSRIGRYINYAQNNIFNTHTFRFSEKSVTGILIINEYTFDMQADWQVTIGGVLVDPTDSKRQFKLNTSTYVSSDMFFDAYPDPASEAANLPSAWTEFGDQIYFNCPLDKAYTLNLRYYRNPTPLTNDTAIPEVPEVFRELLELYADYRAEKYRGNHDVAATYKQEYEDGLESMQIRHNGRSMGARKAPSNGRVRVSN